MEKKIVLKIEDTFFTQYFWPENFRINELVNSYNLAPVLTSYPNYPNFKNFKNFKKKEDQKYISSKIFRIPVFLDQPVTFQFS